MTATLRLKHGQFIGDVSRSARAAGFSFVEIAHTSAIRVPPHTHEDAHFVLVLTGDYSTHARGIGRVCNSPALIFYPPGTTHHDQFRSDVGRFFAISVLPACLSRLSDARAAIEHPVAIKCGEALTLATKMFQECCDIDALSGVVLEGLGLELLAHTARGVKSSCLRSPPAWLKRAMELMRERCSTRLTVREVAAEVGVHPYHLARVTRALLGRSPGEILREFRIQEALGLLTRSSQSIGEIALACGYADQSQFTRSLKRAIGVTPAVFRRNALPAKLRR
jgi:AraC family transcriptional regulator